MRYITLSKLEELGACLEQRRLFKKLFGLRVAVTEKNLLPHADKFSWGWAADHLLCAPARAEYERVRATAGLSTTAFAPRHGLSTTAFAPGRAEYDAFAPRQG